MVRRPGSFNTLKETLTLSQTQSTTEHTPQMPELGNLVLLHPANALRNLSPLIPYWMALTSVTARRLGQQVERNGGLLADYLTCTELPKAVQLNQAWSAETQRSLTFWVGEVNDLTRRALRDVADHFVIKK